MSREPSVLERYLHDHIPITREMSIRVVRVDDHGVRLSAPLAPNINHRSTVFGGSASAVAILAAWSLVHFRLREEGVDGRVVIQRNSVEYLSPIDDDFEAFCAAPPEPEWKRFTAAVARRGKGRLHLRVELSVGGRKAGHFEGVYVAFGREQAPASR